MGLGFFGLWLTHGGTFLGLPAATLEDPYTKCKPKEELQCRLYGGGLMTKVQASIQKRPQGKKERVAYVCTVMSAPDMPAWLRLSALTRV